MYSHRMVNMWTVVGCLCLFAATSCGAALAQTRSLVVHTEQGPVRGYEDPEGGFYSFHNVPYATAPTGVNKYKAPLPAPVWTEIFEAVDRRIICPQLAGNHMLSRPPYNMQDDCLVANIFVPDTNATNLPVLVNIHGGAYQIGYGNHFQITSLVKTNRIIAVTFNFRLGVKGFLCLGTDDIPGNAGMKDQVALLRWVQRSIASFGGNPDEVTINGCSAAGGSVDFLSLSPMTAGLYKKSITESGVSVGGVGAQIDPIKNAKRYAASLNHSNVDDMKALEEFYKTASNELLSSGYSFIYDDDGTTLLLTPCIERETGVERFLDDAPVNILKKGNYNQVPNLYGFSNMEGLLKFLTTDFDETKEKMNEKFSDFLPRDLQFESEEQKEEVSSKIKKFYFGNEAVSEETILGYIDYYSDVMFVYPMLRVLNLRRKARNDTVYLYEYSFVDENTPIVPHTNDVRGADHCGPMTSIQDEDVTNASEAYKTMKENMREIWVHFSEYGHPVPEGSSFPTWLPVSGVNSPYMYLNATSGLAHTTLLEERMRFWDPIYEQHYRVPVPPSAANTALAFPIYQVFATVITAFHWLSHNNISLL